MAVTLSIQTRQQYNIRLIWQIPLSWLVAYSQIYFARNRVSGALFMAATFVVPSHGASGLMGLAATEFWAWLLNRPVAHRQDGYYGFNGLLVGLALGLYYTFSPSLIGLLLVATLLTVMVASALRSLTERYLGVPVLSLAFVWVSWIALLATRRLNGVEVTLAPVLASGWGAGLLPPMVELFLRSLAAALFQINLVSGLLIFIGLVWFSRWAAILAVIGFASGTMVYTLLGGATADLEQEILGFNFILSAIAVGGIWLVLHPISLLLAAAAGGLAAILSAALLALFGTSGLPVLAMPFIVTTQLFLFALTGSPSAGGVRLVTGEPSSPEENLRRALHRDQRFTDPSVPVVFLPVMGRWIITQGPNGEHTHQGLWQHAWDFEVFCNGISHVGDGLNLSDYHAYQAPVVAPADGKVVRVVNHLEDNPVGEVDTRNNWGNLVIIWHTGGVYSALCHLEKGSITVGEGETVQAGQILGKVGNSGRSPIPHLHFQLQRSPEIGAPTCYGEFIHFLINSEAKTIYQSHGVPDKGDEVAPIDAHDAARHAVNLGVRRGYNWQIEEGGQKRQENWTSEIDQLGVRRLTTVSSGQSGAAVSFYSDSRYTTLLDYEGSSNYLLRFFYMGAAQVPYLGDSMVVWQDQPSVVPFLPVVWRLVNELIMPFGELAQVRTESRMSKKGDRLRVTTLVKKHGGLKRFYDLPGKIVVEFFPGQGPVEISAYSNGQELIRAKRVTFSDGGKNE